MNNFFRLNEYSSPHSSDDEIFTAKKVNVRELKRSIFLGRRTMSAITVSDDSEDRSMELIEMHSEPDLVQSSPENSATTSCRRSFSQPDLRESLGLDPRKSMVTDESFVAMETLISNLSGNSDELERIEQILSCEKEKSILANGIHNVQHPNTIQVKNATPCITKNWNTSTQVTNATPCMTKTLKGKSSSTSDLKKHQNCFKTPTTFNKVNKIQKSGQKCTPLRAQSQSNFQNIVSPIQFYIKNSPQAHLTHTVRPKKPLPGLSSIPKPKNPHIRFNKENVSSNLPSKAYVNAKKTTVIVKPDVKQLPPNNQVKKMASSLPLATVMRHEKRENQCKGMQQKLATPEDSFAKLSLSQADVSVCTVKSAAVTETLKRK